MYELEEIKVQVEKSLANGRIAPSFSQYGVPIHFTKKKDGDYTCVLITNT